MNVIRLAPHLRVVDCAADAAARGQVLRYRRPEPPAMTCGRCGTKLKNGLCNICFKPAA